MKTSKELSGNFKSGDTRPILEAMDIEYETLGLQSNNVISLCKFASFKIGQWVANFSKYTSNSYGYVDYYIKYSKEKPKEIDWNKTLTNSAFASEMLNLPLRDRNMYAEFLLLDEQYIYEPLFWVGCFNNYKESERQRMGKRIKILREESDLTQEQLAEKTGLKRENIARIESGKLSTGQDILTKIAAALGKKLDIV